MPFAAAVLTDLIKLRAWGGNLLANMAPLHYRVTWVLSRLRSLSCRTFALSRKVSGREQRIIVLGDADCFDNAEMLGNRKNIKSDDYQLGTGLFYWLSYGEVPIDIRRPLLPDNKIDMTKQSMSMVKLLYIWILPGMLAIWGILIWVRRKRR